MMGIYAGWYQSPLMAALIALVFVAYFLWFMWFLAAMVLNKLMLLWMAIHALVWRSR